MNGENMDNAARAAGRGKVASGSETSAKLDELGLIISRLHERLEGLAESLAMVLEDDPRGAPHNGPVAVSPPAKCMLHVRLDSLIYRAQEALDVLRLTSDRVRL